MGEIKIENINIIFIFGLMIFFILIILLILDIGEFEDTKIELPFYLGFHWSFGPQK